MAGDCYASRDDALSSVGKTGQRDEAKGKRGRGERGKEKRKKEGKMRREREISRKKKRKNSNGGK